MHNEIEQRASAIAAALSGMTNGPLEAVSTSRREPAHAPPNFDYRRTSRFLRWYDGVLQAHRATANTLADQNLSDACSEELQPLMRAVTAAHRWLLVHPMAAKSLFSALVAQGRSYARSPEGQALERSLARSPQVRSAALLWRSLSLGMLAADEPGELPETYLDNLLRAIDKPDLVALLGQLAYVAEQDP